MIIIVMIVILFYNHIAIVKKVMRSNKSLEVAPGYVLIYKFIYTFNNDISFDNNDISFDNNIDICKGTIWSNWCYYHDHGIYASAFKLYHEVHLIILKLFGKTQFYYLLKTFSSFNKRTCFSKIVTKAEGFKISSTSKIKWFSVEDFRKCMWKMSSCRNSSSGNAMFMPESRWAKGLSEVL